MAESADLLSRAVYRVITTASHGEFAFPSIRDGVVAAGVSTEEGAEPFLIVTPQFAEEQAGYVGRGIQDAGIRSALTKLRAAFDQLRLRPPEAGWDELMSSVRVHVEPPPRAHWGLGDAANTTLKSGTFGGAVVRPGGDTALLTAGHVTSSWNDPQTQHGDQGKTEFEEEPFSWPTDTVCADVAVVSFGQGSPTSTQAINGYDVAYAGDSVDVHLRSGTVTDSINSYLDYIRYEDPNGNQSNAFVGACMRLSRAVTVAGDSGAAVTRSGSDVLLGHVVGGLNAPTVSYTLVQSIIWQLAAVRCKLADLP